MREVTPYVLLLDEHCRPSQFDRDDKSLVYIDPPPSTLVCSRIPASPQHPSFFRRHYSHQRHTSTTRRNNADMETPSLVERPPQSVRPHSLSTSSYPDFLEEPVPQPFRLDPGFPEPRAASQRYQGERVRRCTVDRSRKGEKVACTSVLLQRKVSFFVR